MTYNIVTKSGIETVEGEVFEVDGYKLGVNYEKVDDKWGSIEYWTVTELSTGMEVYYDYGKEPAIAEAKRLFKYNDPIKFIERAKKELAKYGYKFPVNP